MTVNVAVFPTNCSNTVNVYDRFTTVLRLYFALYAIDWIRTLFIFLALCCESPLILRLFDGSGCCQSCYSFACLIILHVYRFQPSGKYVSGDWMTSDQASTARQNLANAYSTWYSQPSGTIPPYSG